VPILTTQSAKGYGFSTAVGSTLLSDFESIQSYTVSGSSTNTITFSSIPSTYRNLQLRYSWLASSATTGGATLQIRINSDTGGNYNYLQGLANMSDESVKNTGAETGQTEFKNPSGYMGFTTADSTTAFSFGILDIHEYKNTSIKKPILWRETRNRNTTTHPTARVSITSGHWASTSAITSIEIKVYAPSGINFVADSTFDLYGIGG
jgi:hypothetical protein